MSLCVKKAFKHDACQQKLVSTYTQMGKQADLQGLNIKFQLFRLYPFVCYEQDYILNKKKKRSRSFSAHRRLQMYNHKRTC